MSQNVKFTLDSFRLKDEEKETDKLDGSSTDTPLETETRESERNQIVYYDFDELVSKPKISPNFTLPVDGCPVLQLADSFGYDSWRRNNLHVVGLRTLAFVAGSYVRVYRTDTKQNTFLRCTGDGSVACLAVSPSRSVFASGERGTKPVINIFGYPSSKVRKVLKNGTEREYVSMTFEPTEGGLLASQGGEPDHNLTIWHWQKEVPLLQCKAFSQDVYTVAFSQELFGSLATSGLGHIRFWTMAVTFTGLKLKGAIGRFGGHELTNVEAFVLFSEGKVVSGCDEGTLLLWEEALLKAEFTLKEKDFCHRGKITQMFIYEDEILTLGEDGYIRTWNADDIIFVEPDFHGQRFQIPALLEIPVGEQSSLIYMIHAEPRNPGCFDWYAQDKGGKIWSVDLSLTLNVRPPKVELHFHGGPVLACAASPNTHLVATGGHDGSVRIFDCIQRMELLMMSFSTPVSSLLWVPLSVDVEGASVMVGFDDGVIRKLVFCDPKNPEDTENKKPRKLKGQLSQVFKAHKDRVASLAFSLKGDVFVSGSEDKTIFVFRMRDTEFAPIGWLSVPTSVRQLQWTPFHFIWQGVLAVCEDGIVIQIKMNLFIGSEVAANFQFVSPKFQMFKFQSIKSDIQHEEKMGKMKAELAKMKGKKTEEGEEKHKDPVAKKMEDDIKQEEENWQPYYPDTPSPILQALYSQQVDCFWLTLGEYDAGYVYYCRFPPIYYHKEDTSLHFTKPEKAVVVPDCSDIPITVLKVHQTSLQSLALLGFQNGHIRLVQLPGTMELDNISTYWELNVHDDKNGSLTGIEFAFDCCYLVTTGMDGNIFVFSYTGLLEKSTKTSSTLPLTIQHHEICSGDISGDALGFADNIDKEREQKAMREAEISKKEKRQVLKEIQHQVRQLLNKNDQLPARHRLARNELLVNINLQKEDMERRQEKIAELSKICAWQQEKTRLLLEKVKSGFLRHEELPSQFAVRAFKQSIQVKSYRTCHIFPALEEFLTAASPEKKESPIKRETDETTDSNQESKEISMDDVWQRAYAMTQRRSLGLTGTVARSLKMTLDKALKAKRKQVARKAEWAELYDEKVHVDKDNPEDLRAIEHAKQTIGDIKLKTDPLHAVQLAHSYSQETACRSLAQLDRDYCDKINEFNKNLVTLREEKLLVLQVFEALNQYLYQISGGVKSLSNPPQLSEEEIPEAKFVFDDQTIYKFKKDLEVLLQAVPDSENMFISQSAHNVASSDHIKKPLSRGTYYKGECSDVPGIIKFALKQNLSDIDETSVNMSISGEPIGDDHISPLQEELIMFSTLLVDFQKSLMESFLGDLMEDFDEKLRDLFRQRFELDVLLKQADSFYICKLEEFLLSKKTSIKEKELTDGAIKRKQELKRTHATSVQLKKQIVKKNEETEHISKKISDLWLHFQRTVADKSGTKMMRFLTRLYKRKKIKKKVSNDSSDEDDDTSESESFSSGSESGSDTSVSLDLNYCPEELEPELYAEVVELQKQRQDLDDQLNENKEDIILLNKEFEHTMKEAEALKKFNEKMEEQVHEFFEEKIKMLNEIITVVTLLESRINCRVSDGLVLNKRDLLRLSNRVSELKKDVKFQIHAMKEHSWKDVAIRRANRLLRGRIDTWTEKCEEEILKKFGRPVSLTDLNLVTLNPKLEMLRFQLVLDKDRQAQEQNELSKEIQGLKTILYNKMAKTTIRYQVKTDLMMRKRALEQNLNLCSGNQNLVLEDEVRKHKVREQERRKFGHLLQQQMSVMHNCCVEMTGILQRGTSRACKLAPISKRYTLQKSLGSRNVPVAVPEPGLNLLSDQKKRLHLP